jgi:DNA polymerase III subunit delta
MQINFTQLTAQLSKETSPIYLLTGDEPLLLQEAQTLIRAQAETKGFEERELIFIDHNFKISTLQTLTESGCLFAQKRVIDIRQQTAKIDSSMQKWLQSYCENPNPDILIILSASKLTAAQKKTKWVKSIANTGLIVTIWPVQPRELPRWIKTKLRNSNISADQASIDMLAHFTEGNLLATHQAILKLPILFPNQPITAEKVKQVISDNARFNVFDFSQYTMLGQTEKSQRVLKQLKMSGAEPTLILWSLAREIRLIHNIVFLKEASKPYQQIINAEWKSRQNMVRLAATRCKLQVLEALLKMCHQADKSIKGLDQSDIWLLLSQITTGLSKGVNL